MNKQQVEKCWSKPENGQSKPETKALPTTIPTTGQKTATGENHGMDVDVFVRVLTPVEQQVLKDTLLHGCWGDGEYEFLVEDKKDCHVIETAPMMGYCTNDAQRGGHYKGRVLTSTFRNIYRKMCPAERNKVGYVLSHANNWWGDGTGDMLFIRHEWHEAFEQWAKGGEQ